MKISVLKTALGKMEEGAWLPVPALPGVQLHVKSPVSRDFVFARDTYTTSLYPDKDYFDLTKDEQNEVMLHVFAYGLVTDWRGFTDDDNNNVPYDPELFVSLYREYENFRNIVLDLIVRFNEKVVEVETARDEARLKNSRSASGMTSDSAETKDSSGKRSMMKVSKPRMTQN